MTRFAMSSFVVACVAMLLALVGGESSAAPVPKDGGKDDTAPELNVLFDGISKAVKDEKWPKEEAEKRMTDTVRDVFTRTLKAADQKERGLPIDFSKLKKVDVAKEAKDVSANSKFLIVGNVKGGAAYDAVIFTTGKVELTSARNSVIVAKTALIETVSDSIIITSERFGYMSVGGSKESGSVLVSGQWIDVPAVENTICHVTRPSGLPCPPQKPDGKKHPAIRIAVANNVTFLNDRDDLSVGRETNCTYLKPKNPIAK